MQQKRLKLGAVLLLIFALTSVNAQEVMTATGGNSSGNGGSSSYSIGQVVYTTNTGTNGSVSQGVQQPFEISVLTEIKNTTEIDLIVSVFPNPTTDFLTLKVGAYDKPNLAYQLYNIDGKLLETKKIEGKQTNINMSQLKPSTYLLKVVCKEEDTARNVVKTFKIVKTK